MSEQRDPYPRKRKEGVCRLLNGDVVHPLVGFKYRHESLREGLEKQPQEEDKKLSEFHLYRPQREEQQREARFVAKVHTNRLNCRYFARLPVSSRSLL